MSAGLPRYLDARCRGCGQWGCSLDDRGYCDGCRAPDPDDDSAGFGRPDDPDGGFNHE